MLEGLVSNFSLFSYVHKRKQKDRGRDKKMWKELFVVILLFDVSFASTTCFSQLNFTTSEQGVLVNGERFYIKVPK